MESCADLWRTGVIMKLYLSICIVSILMVQFVSASERFVASERFRNEQECEEYIRDSVNLEDNVRKWIGDDAIVYQKGLIYTYQLRADDSDYRGLVQPEPSGTWPEGNYQLNTKDAQYLFHVFKTQHEEQLKDRQSPCYCLRKCLGIVGMAIVRSGNP